jgi:predicted nucleic acid-binding protein
MRYTLDTNVLLFYVRDAATRQFIEDTYAPFDPTNEAIISIVSVGEMMVLAAANNWGRKKLQLVQKLIDKLVIVELRYSDLINSYIEIEKYNRNIHPTKKRSGSHIKMGKNDIWIAATALSTKSKLISTDKDFAHLDGEFFDVLIIDQAG